MDGQTDGRTPEHGASISCVPHDNGELTNLRINILKLRLIQSMYKFGSQIRYSLKYNISALYVPFIHVDGFPFNRFPSSFILVLFVNALILRHFSY